RVIAAVSAAAAFFVCLSCVSAAPFEGSDGARFIFFSGTDLWRDGAFAYGGLLWSPDGLDQEGFTFKGLLAAGAYRYNSGAFGGAQVTGIETAGRFLPGWRFKSRNVEVKLFAGVDIENHRLLPDDPSSGLRGNDIGIATAIDLWYEPAPNTMVALHGSLSSIAASYSARTAFGWRAFDLFYIGPETQIFGCNGYDQIRAGVHLTALRIGETEWSLAAGWAQDSDHRHGGYGRFNVLIRR
ncbi:MAG TPA: cellulose biosynthesis protein BcsS, partial [Pseudolabrys sp.]|nr:cellulose biosynthesis protein BcsS [Pseudolabrys sp.]